MIELIIPSEKRLHKEKHLHHCMIHAKSKCQHPAYADNRVAFCANCMKEESNEVCQKTLRGTELDFHEFPCMSCLIQWRNQYGGETMIDAFIDLEQAARLAHVAPDKNLDEREANEGSTNPEVQELVDATKRI